MNIWLRPFDLQEKKHEHRTNRESHKTLSYALAVFKKKNTYEKKKKKTEKIIINNSYIKNKTKYKKINKKKKKKKKNENHVSTMICCTNCWQLIVNSYMRNYDITIVSVNC